MTRAVAAGLLWVLATGVCLAQSPTGTISGVVRDVSGGTVAGAVITAASRLTHQARKTTTGESGEYSLPALPAGDYDIAVEARGFQRVVLTATVETGSTTRADCVVSVAEVTAAITVAAASPQMRYESAAVTGLIAQAEIAALPLNGRNFLELAKLEPGVQAPSGTNRNRVVVPVLGAPGSNVGGARFTVDGGSVTSIGLGGAQMALSQEIVREFQLSTVNFDLAAGMTHAGAVNVVTRGGSNQESGTAFYFYRDHRLSAYPVLVRDPADPHPFFRR
ncbi:MAG TPA: carboxypeptidase-like regulatory domain-containing protein [Vicinamibacterales bacterium]|nr:carboxypeptidase-like regulatory domain-containing protein [Vicinamibacterales bacterium]